MAASDTMRVPSSDPGAMPKEDREKYSKIEKLGEGTYGVVYKAVARSTNQYVALKKIRVDTWADGVPATAMREISVLKEIRHPCVVGLFDVFVSYSGNLYLVFELLDKDMKHVFDDHRRHAAAVERHGAEGRACPSAPPSTPSRYASHPGGMPLELCRALLYQMVAGLHECHAHRILHRDLKPHNLLINATGELKLADFGLARPCAVPPRAYTHEVVTLWYRAPEVLLGGEVYTASLDMWSVGCIFAEMFTGRPLFPGDSAIDQISRIFQGLGTPTEDVWPGCSALPKYRENAAARHPGRPMGALLPALPAPALDLVASLLRYEPSDRPSALDVLRHPFLSDLTVDRAVAVAAACFDGKPVPELPSPALSGTVSGPPTHAAAATAPAGFATGSAAGAGAGFPTASAFSRASTAASAPATGFGGAAAGGGFPTAGFGGAGPAEEEEDHEM